MLGACCDWCWSTYTTDDWVAPFYCEECASDFLVIASLARARELWQETGRAFAGDDLNFSEVS